MLETNRARMNVLSVILSVVAAGVTVLAMQLSQGAVPIPPNWAWVIPILVAMLTALAPQLKFGSEEPS